jgi:hypothetical protein
MSDAILHMRPLTGVAAWSGTKGRLARRGMGFRVFLHMSYLVYRFVELALNWK